MEEIKGLKKAITISLTPEEYLLTRKIAKASGIGLTDIFRRGLREIEQDSVANLTQDNIS